MIGDFIDLLFIVQVTFSKDACEILMNFFLYLLMSVKHLPLVVPEIEDPVISPVLDHRFMKEGCISFSILEPLDP